MTLIVLILRTKWLVALDVMCVFFGGDILKSWTFMMLRIRTGQSQRSVYVFIPIFMSFVSAPKKCVTHFGLIFEILTWSDYSVLSFNFFLSSKNDDFLSFKIIKMIKLYNSFFIVPLFLVGFFLAFFNWIFLINRFYFLKDVWLVLT